MNQRKGTMKIMSRRKKRGIAVCVLAALVVVWILRFQAVNRYYNQFNAEKIFYQIDETVELGDNEVDTWTDTKGYSLTFHDWEILSFEEALEEYQISDEEKSEMTNIPEYVLVTTLTIFNEDNVDGILPLYYFTLHGVDWIADWNAEFMALLNSEGFDMNYTSEPGTTEEITMVYNLNQLSKPDYRWKQIIQSQEHMWFYLTYLPQRIEVVLQ